MLNGVIKYLKKHRTHHRHSAYFHRSSYCDGKATHVLGQDIDNAEFTFVADAWLAVLFGREVQLDNLIPAFKSYEEHTSELYHLEHSLHKFQHYLHRLI